MTTATASDIEAIVQLVWSVRPDWPGGIVRMVLEAHRSQVDVADLAVAAVRCASNPNMPTPKYIGWRGPHWDGTVTQPEHVAPRARCVVCGKTEDRCYSERPGIDDDHAFEAVSR